MQPQTHQPPYAVELDADRARGLAANGAAVLLLDVPVGTIIGVDHRVFVAGPRFRGVKMLPPGLHALTYQAVGGGSGSGASGSGRDPGSSISAGAAAAGASAGAAPAVSLWLWLKPREVVVRRWAPADEALVPLDDDDEVERYAEGVRRFDFDAGLAPYDYGGWAAWKALTGLITEADLARLLPPHRELSLMAEAEDAHLVVPRTAAERRLAEQLAEGRTRARVREAGDEAAAHAAAPMDADAGAASDAGGSTADGGGGSSSIAHPAPASRPPRWGRCSYTRVPRSVRPPGASGAALTAANLDRTAALEAAAAAAGDASGRALLAELQFAFAAFVFGQSLEGFMQWKELVTLLLGCERGPLSTHARLFVAAIGVIRLQLAFGLPGGAGAGAGAAGAAAVGQPGGSADGSSVIAALAGAGATLGAPFVDELLPGSFLRRALAGFYETLADAGASAPPALAAEARALAALLRERLGWRFAGDAEGAGSGNGGGISGSRHRHSSDDGAGSDDDGDGDGDGDDGEDGPTVVELTEAERRLAGIDI